MFYETKHPLRGDYLKTETGENYSFPPHMHRHFEFIAVTEGEMQVTVDGKEYTLCKNGALLIFPNQIHSLYTAQKSRHILCIFSPDLVKAFSSSAAGKIPESNRFTVPEFYIKLLAQGERDTISAKGLLYSICGCFARDAKYREDKAKRVELLEKIFEFVEENRSGNCSLYDLAAATSYDYAYLSKYFKRTVGISFCDYVNAYRLGDACYLLKNSALPAVQIAYECGFTSVRSFNRNFKESFCITPSEYRAKK